MDKDILYIFLKLLTFVMFEMHIGVQHFSPAGKVVLGKTRQFLPAQEKCTLL